MYQPKFNSVLVEIDDADSEWGGGNDESMLGASFSKGKVIDHGMRMSTQAYPVLPENKDFPLTGQDIMWNEGDEAGTIFEEDGKKYGFIYWWSIRGVKDAK